MTDEQIRSFWTADQLRTWSDFQLEGVGIPIPSKRFLSRIGMPVAEGWSLRFDPSRGLPLLQDSPNLRVLGSDHEMPLCIDETRGGAVIVFEDVAAWRMRYMNRDVEHFAAFLVLYQTYRITVPQDDEGAALTLIDEIEDRMRTEDPSAFSDAENGWPVILEQMRDGLL